LIWFPVQVFLDFIRNCYKFKQKMKNLQLYIKIILSVLLLYFLLLMLEITIPYLSFKDDVAFLRIKRSAIKIPFWKIAFYVHVLTSCFTLLAGFTQFSGFMLRKFPDVHKTLGRFYVVLIIFLAAPSGFVMGIYANGGICSRIAFILLSLFWWWTTYMAYRTAKTSDWSRHSAYMFRSFALTLSAITLRAWKVVIVSLFAPQPMDLYRIVAWLGWIPNLLLAEWLIRQKIPEKMFRKIKSKN
jgi:uncharacterized membrane protein